MTPPAEAERSLPPWFGHVIGCGLLLCTIALLPRVVVLPERFTLAKELVLHAAAVIAISATLWLRRLELDDLASGLIAVAVLSVVSAALANNAWEGMRAAAITLSGVSIFVTVRRLPRPNHYMITWIAAGASVLAVTVVLEAFGVLKGISSTGRAPGGVMGNRNNAAHMLALALPVVWLAIIKVDRIATRRLLLVATGIAGCALTLTRSRAGWLATILGLAVLVGAMFVTATRRRTIAFLLCLSVGVGVALVVPTAVHFRSGYLDTAQRLLERREGTGRGRLIQYGNTVRMAADAPVLGVGPGNWQFHYGRYASADDPSYSRAAILTPTNAIPQSDWLGYLAERGIPVFAILTIVAFSLFRSTAIYRRALDSPRDIALASTLIVLAVLGSLDAVIQLPAGMYLSAAALAALAPRDATRGGRLIANRGVHMSVATLAIVFGVHASYMTVNRIRARQLSGHWYNDALDARRLERAASLDPGSAEIRALTARAWMMEDRCDLAEHHIVALLRVDATMPAAVELRELCPVSRPGN